MLYCRLPSLLVFFALLLTAPAGALALDASDSTAAAAGGALTPVQAAALVHYDPSSGTLGVKAEQLEFGALLRAVAEQAGIGVAVGSGVSGKVTVAFSGQPLEEGIRRIVAAAGAGNIAAEYTRIPGEEGPAAYRIEKISVLGSGSATQALTQQVPRSTGSASIDTGGESLDQTQPEFRNRTTSPKKTNREARFGPERSGAGSGEEQRLRSLMRAAQQGDVAAIGLLGQMGHRPAAPILARIVARLPEGSPVRTAAAAALQQLAVARSAP